MKQIKMIWCGLTLLASLASSAYEWDLIDNTTAPGTVLESGFYQVNGIVKISAADDPGQSALRVAPGAMVSINIPFGSTLTVVGGNAEGMIGAGAGIEVPADSKLLVCGYGLLYAQGGSAAPGSTGRAGEDGEMTAFFDVKPEEAESLSEDDLPDPLICLMTGAGGDGGNGGGGAAAGIGGRGGRGGAGGKGGASHPVVDEGLWLSEKEGKPNRAVYETWLKLLGHDLKDVYLYDEDDFEKLGTDGLPGADGEDGKAAGSCGDIVIGEGVQIVAIPGLPGTPGSGGAYGEAFSGPDLESWNFSPVKMFLDGLEILCADPDDYDEEEEEEEDRRATLWAFGGGGGGGGAGGAGAPQGIGPGGAGGAGGGGAGGGLFAYAANANDDVEMNGGAGAGGAGFYVTTIFSWETGDTIIRTDGEEGDESEHVNLYDDDGYEQDDFNVITNAVPGIEVDLDRLCATSLKFYDEGEDPVFYQAGLGGEGGRAGKELSLGERKIFVSEEASILTGLEAENQQSFLGEVILPLHLGDQTIEMPCGWIVSPVPVPESRDGFFMGYFTEDKGRGEPYFDCLGLPVGQHQLWNEMTLYPHFADEQPADIHKLEFRSFESEEAPTGELVASIWVREGRPLPSLGSKMLDKIRGWRVMGAYLPGSTAEDVDWWYDEDGLPIKEGDQGEAYEYDREGDLVLHVLLAPKWEMIAEMPETNVVHVYTGKGFSGVDLKSDEYEVVGGTSVATNVGNYVTTIRLKDGYEIWDDFLESPATATALERTVEWQIVRANLDQLTLPNRVYDWTKTNSTFEVSGAIPAGVKVTYEMTKVLGNGTVEMRANVDGGKNYRSKTMTATWTIPELLRIETVVSHYPWNTQVELDVRANPLYTEGVYTNRPDSVVIPVTEDGYKFTSAALTVKEATSDKGTFLLDLKDALASGRKTFSIYLTIDDLPCSYPVKVSADTTATVDEKGIPTYAITDPAQILPINHSWRWATEAKRYPTAETQLEISRDAEIVKPFFRPVDRAGLRVNEGVVGWVPQEDGTYELNLMVANEKRRTAKFTVAYAAAATFPTVAYVGETPYASLAEAVLAADALSGEVRSIRVAGDVQAEDVMLPDGAEAISIVYDRGGVFDATRQFEVPENQLPSFNEIYALTGYTPEEGADVVSRDRPPAAPIRMSDDYQPLQIVENFNDGQRGLMEVCASCNAVKVTLESAGSFDGGRLQVVEFARVGDELKGKVMLRDVNGNLKPLKGKLMIPRVTTIDLRDEFYTNGYIEFQDGEFTLPCWSYESRRFYKIQ